MNPTVSTYLNLARFAAALAVLVAHIEEVWVRELVPFVIHLGIAAVGVFFVISGFVIAHVSGGSERDPKTYVANRVSRLYSVVVPCLIATFVLDRLGLLVLADYYARTYPPLPADFHRELRDLVVSLTFLNNVWFFELVPGSNAPYWSLCLEAAYYALFGFYLANGRKALTAATLLVALVVGPRTLMLLPLWLLGHWCHRVCRERRMAVGTARGLLVAAALAYVAMTALRARFHIGMDAPRSIEGALWQFYAAGIPFAASVVAINFAALSLRRVERVVDYLAGATFTLYLLHFPLGRFVNGLLPSSLSPPGRWVLLFTTTIALSLVFAHFTERRKRSWKVVVTRAADRLAALRGRRPAG